MQGSWRNSCFCKRRQSARQAHEAQEAIEREVQRTRAVTDAANTVLQQMDENVEKEYAAVVKGLTE